MAAFLGSVSLAIAGEHETFAVTVRRVYTSSSSRDRAVIDGATIIVEDGKFRAVGVGIEVPEGVRHYSLPSHVIIPGLIDAETTLTSDRQDTPRSIAPDVRAVDAWDYLEKRDPLLRGGVTCVYVAPGVSVDDARSARLISGRGAVIKTAGHDAWPPRRVVRETSGVQLTLGAISRSQPSIYDPPVGATADNPFEVLDIVLPQSRAGQFLALRQTLDDAKDFADQVRAAFEASEAPPAAPLDLASLLPLVRGDDFLRARATKAHDIYRLLEIAEARGIRVVLETDAEVLAVAPLLEQHGVPVIFPGAFRPGSIAAGDASVESLRGESDESAFVELARAGVEVVLTSPSDGEVKDLLLQAATAVGLGVDPHDALRAITSRPAEILGVGDRIGSIEPGKDADFVILGGEPFAAGSETQAVVIDGQIVYQDAPEIDGDATVLRCGRIADGRGRTIEGGLIVVRGGKIDYVGPGGVFQDLAGAREVIDAHDATVVPGFIDAGSVIGIHAESLAPVLEAPSGAAGGGGSAAFRLADAISPSDPALLELASSGITTALITPVASGPFSGQVSAIKLAAASREAMMIKPYAAQLLATTSVTALKKAKDHLDELAKHEAQKAELEKKGDKAALEALKAPAEIEEFVALRPVFSGEVPALLPVTDGEQLEAILKAFRATYGIRAIVYRLRPSEAGDFDKAAAAIAGAGGILLDAPFVIPAADGKPELNVAREWAARGVSFSFRSLGGTGGRFLPLQVAYAVRRGLDPRDALAALTHESAVRFGIADRVGSIEKGKDADLVILSGDPFELTTRVRGVMIDGRIVFEEGE